MPGVGALRAAEEERRDPDLRRAAEETKLWLPSDLTVAQRRRVCKPSLVDAEAKLRRVQCNDALRKIRGHLYTITHLIYQRNANAVGQRATTRAGTLMGRVSDQRKREVAKYRDAFAALERLKGPGWATELRELADGDLKVRRETESDAAARRKLGRIGSTRPNHNEPTVRAEEEGGSGEVSWIWFAVDSETEEVRVHDCKSFQRRFVLL
jgi:hypothetical protein